LDFVEAKTCLAAEIAGKAASVAWKKKKIVLRNGWLRPD